MFETAEALLADLIAAGATLKERDGRLEIVAPRGAVPRDLLRRARAHRSELLGLFRLRSNGRDPARWRSQRNSRRFSFAQPDGMNHPRSQGSPARSGTIQPDRPSPARRRWDGSYIARNPRRRPVIDLIRQIQQTDPTWAEQWTDEWKERVAICEVEGELPPEQAEAVALKELQSRVERGRSES